MQNFPNASSIFGLGYFVKTIELHCSPGKSIPLEARVEKAH
jgi:hypothetical protein